MQKTFQTINIPKLPVLTTEEAINLLKKSLNQIQDWKNINELIPMFYVNKKNVKKTGLAGIFAASLELVKEGSLKILQKDLFKNVMIKKN